ncbi:MAG: hypothetical protein ACD_17C00159G0001 [uncultured bacterium]|nr:MAG: hypothetical protein ACD_17C00159G0001 [uncultured bacterium]
MKILENRFLEDFCMKLCYAIDCMTTIGAQMSHPNLSTFYNGKPSYALFIAREAFPHLIAKMLIEPLNHEVLPWKKLSDTVLVPLL